MTDRFVAPSVRRERGPSLLRRALVPASLAVAVALVAGPSRGGDKETCASAAEEAQQLRKEGKLRAAREQIITCARNVCPAVIRNDCTKWLGEVDGSMPTVVLRVRDKQGKDVVKVVVTVDGQPFATQLAGMAQPLDPGPHTFRYEAEGMEPFEEQLVVSQGEKDRVLRVELSPKAASASVPPTPSASPTAAPSAAPDTTGGRSVAPWVVGGIGVAGLATFGVLEALGQSQYSDLKDGCGKTAQKCSDSDVSSVRVKFQIAAVGLAVGVVGVGVAVGMFALGGSSRAADAAVRHVDFVATRGGGVATVRSSF